MTIKEIDNSNDITYFETVQERVLAIETIRFDFTEPWVMFDGESRFNVEINDPEFIELVNKGKSFVNGDALKVKLQVNSAYGRSLLRTRYIATKVLEIIFCGPRMSFDSEFDKK